ncbi:TRAP transporter small permease subunit [Roseibium algae]|uniref:TRAP transporter small permease protein n=1 Tax=Roseibium algae TaxID=3123038 RepID=A0ABU8THH6_9HYPH
MAGTLSSPDQPETFIKFDGVLGRIENIFNLIAASSILILMFLAVAQVLGRFFLNMPVPGFIDITEQAMAVFAFCGVAYCQRVGGHIRMEMVLGKLKGRAMWVAEMVGVILIAIAVFLLIWGSWFHFYRSWSLGDSTMDIGFVTWPSKLVIPVALSLLFLRLMMQIYGYLRLVINPDATPYGVPVIQDVTEAAQHEIEEAFGDDITAGDAK